MLRTWWLETICWPGGFRWNHRVVGVLLLTAVLLPAPFAVAQPGIDEGPPADLLDGPPPPPDDDFPGPPRERGWRGRDGRHPGAMLWRRMSDEERTELREFIAEEYPDRFDMMLEAEGRDPGGFRNRMGRILPEMIRMKELRDRDPELFAVRKGEQQAEFELRRLVRRFRFATSDEDRAKLAEKIRPLVEKQFDTRQRRMAEEVDRLEERIGQLRARIARQADNRDAGIEKMYQYILEGGPRGIRSMMDEDGQVKEGKRRGGRKGKFGDRRRPPPAEDVHAVPEPDGE